MTALSNREQFGELMVMPGDWGLPSIDLRCLTVMAYVRFTGAPIQFTTAKAPNHSSKTISPSTSPRASKNACKVRPNASFNTSAPTISPPTSTFPRPPAPTSSPTATCSSARSCRASSTPSGWTKRTTTPSLGPGTPPSLPFYYRWFIPLRMQSKAQGRIFSLYDMERISEEELESQVYESAKEGLSVLSNKLGDNEYLLGASPTSLDAIVFGYVATVAKIPFPHAPLHQHLVNKCPNLIDYMERIINVYFPECVPASTNNGGRNYGQRTGAGDSSSTAPPPPSTSSPSTGEYSYSLRDKLLFGGVALLAFAAYAVASGLVQFEYEKVEDEDDDEDSGPHPVRVES